MNFHVPENSKKKGFPDGVSRDDFLQEKSKETAEWKRAGPEASVQAENARFTFD
ncbi:hypothetical protein [Staphylospora marina]|uniref:hypothetical protein n=1 Tax=Staphylospora marina TaxID=2490858 RepID=UPI001F1528FB|nr:hypothetical protein [Staphylospora marina]